MKPETEKLLEEMVSATHGPIGPEEKIQAALRVFVEKHGLERFRGSDDVIDALLDLTEPI